MNQLLIQTLILSSDGPFHRKPPNNVHSAKATKSLEIKSILGKRQGAHLFQDHSELHFIYSSISIPYLTVPLKATENCLDLFLTKRLRNK